jgi:hypothetical protein
MLAPRRPFVSGRSRKVAKFDPRPLFNGPPAAAKRRLPSSRMSRRQIREASGAIQRPLAERLGSTRFTLTGADPSQGILLERPLCRAGKRKTLYVTMLGITDG